MNNSLHEIVKTFINNCSTPFSLGTLKKHISEKMAKNRTITDSGLAKILEMEMPVFHNVDDDTYVPEHLYFVNNKLLVQPTSEELEHTILIPGHHFLPFYDRALSPWEVTLEDSEQKEIARKMDSLFTIEDLVKYYSLFDIANLPFLLISDNESNRDHFAADSEEMAKRKMSITVFDMQEFYAKHNFQPGDFLECTCLDYINGLFRIDYLPAEEAARRNPDQWVARLDEAFDEYFENYGLQPDITRQMAMGFYLAGTEQITEPALHMGGYLSQSSMIDVMPLQNHSVLWYEDEEPDLSDAPELNETPPFLGDCYSLDAILTDIGLSFDSELIEAYIRDALFQRKKNPEDVIQRCFSGREMTFASEEQEEAFYSLVDELWNSISASYNIFTDQERGALRQQVLELVDKMTAFIRELDSMNVHPEDLPIEDIGIAGEMTNHLEQYLYLLENEEITPDLKQNTEGLLKQTGEMIDRLITEIKGSL